MSPSELDELTRAGFSCHTWSNDGGFWYPVHTHPYDKLIIVLEGSVIFYLPESEKEVELKTSGRLAIPAGTEHSATVGPNGVTCLEGQKPC